MASKGNGWCLLFTLLTFSIFLSISLLAPTLLPADDQAASIGEEEEDDEEREDEERMEKTRRRLYEYAHKTWRSFAAMTDQSTGLPADNIRIRPNDPPVLSGYTSPTNIANYLWSIIAARDLRIISAREAGRRIVGTLSTLETMERAHGFYFNWYDPSTGERLIRWPVDGSPLRPFLSTVDNGWLAAALMILRRAVPRFTRRANALLEGMDFAFFYDPAAGLLRGGYWTDTGQYTGFHYGTLNTEPRIASYLGIALGQLPADHYYRMYRSFPTDWDWQEQRPEGRWEVYNGVAVFQGYYQYRGLNIVPSWGGSMFEALMVPLLVPEALWGPTSWGITHDRYVQAQIKHGLEEAGYGYWGFSPANNPAGGYREYGVDAIGMRPDGYASNNDNTLVDYGYPPNRPPQPLPPPEAYTNGVVTPHAVFLALPYAPLQALHNLELLRRNFSVYGAYGFYDSVNVQTGTVSPYHLALDQGMIMAALANYLLDSRLLHYFAPQIEGAVRPLLVQERFFLE